MQGRRESRREREREQRKTEILSVALGLFSKRGFRNVSIQEIADAAEFAVGTLYNLFDGKDAMFDEIYSRSASRITDAFLAFLDGPGTERESLSRFILQLPDILEQHSDFINLYIAEIGQPCAQNSQVDQKAEIRRVVSTTLNRLIDRGIRKGMFHPVDSRMAAKAITALIETLASEIRGTTDKKEVVKSFQKAEAFILEDLLAPRENKK